jgi:cytoskeleton protein RodZ
MTEGEQGLAGAGDAAKPKTAGQWLKAVRQERGLHIAALAALLKVPQAKLEALEADRYADLPDATFARALAKAVCRTLKVDAAPVMALLPRGDEHELHVSLGINEPYREPGRGGEGFSPQWLSKPIVWVAGLILLGAVGVYLAPASWLERAPASAASATVSEPVAMATPSASFETPAASAPASTPVTAPLTSAASEPAIVAAAPPQPVSSPAPAAVKPSQAVPAAVQPAAASASAPARGELALTLKTTAPSWVEVIDAKGGTLISKVIAGGEEAQLSGPAPLKVKIGNVAGTQLLVRGKAVDLLSQAKDNVARLEIN